MTRFPGVPSQRWTPIELGASLLGWYDASVASSVTTATGGVSQWDDLSGNGKHATQATSGNRPDSVTDGIDFVPANNDHLITDVATGTVLRCCAAVLQSDSTTGLRAIVGDRTAVGWLFAINGDKLHMQVAGVGDILTAGTTAVTTGGNRIVLGNSTASTWRVSVNGTAQTGSHSVSVSNSAKAELGARNGGTGTKYDGIFREVVICTNLATADQERLEGYLAWKWGLVSSLAAGHPYKDQSP